MLHLLASTALACGGLFCDTAIPVSQIGEAVVFAVDPEDGTTTMHVTVRYAGDAEAFAWVLPVPAEPEVLRSSASLFTRLDIATRPTWRFQMRDVGCRGDQPDFGMESDTDTDTDADSDTDTDADTDVGSVVVTSQQRVGPYESVVLASSDVTAVQLWLQDHGYAVPAGTDALLAPYASETSHFLALRLASDRTVGDLEPVALRFAGTEPSLPIQLTAVAVEPDMPIDVFLLGPSRALPSNYLHFEPNPLRVDWWDPYTDEVNRLSRGADEAGGRAFTTAFAGSPNIPLGLPRESQLAELRMQSTLFGWLDWMTIVLQPFSADGPSPAELAAIVDLPPDAPVSPEDLFACWWCYPSMDRPLDGVVATARLDEAVLAPLRDAAELLERASTLTRLQTTMSAAEMTVDPAFRFVDGLDDVLSTRVLELGRMCNGRTADSTRYDVRVGDLAFQAPSDAELRARGTSLREWLLQASDHETLTVGELTPRGLENLVDNSGDIEELGMACGCSSQGGPLGALLGVPFLLVSVARGRGRA
ncbi:MAG: DUF2330 domain-containing protein [Myxococcales bacterium]|nr:DUF2330 domain-containing protein [Myxococcales bacterium]